MAVEWVIKLAVGAAKLQQAIVESSPPICGERHKCRLKHLKLMKKKKHDDREVSKPCKLQSCWWRWCRGVPLKTQLNYFVTTRTLGIQKSVTNSANTGFQPTRHRSFTRDRQEVRIRTILSTNSSLLQGWQCQWWKWTMRDGYTSAQKKELR